MLKNGKVSDLALAVVLGACFFYVTANPHVKIRAERKINLETLVPSEFEGWKSVPHDTSTFKDEWQSINELLLREYYREDLYSLRALPVKRVGFVLEYGSDLRNNFTFHFPENCHRASGNRVDFMKPLEVTMRDGSVYQTKLIFIEGIKGTTESINKLVAYWLVIGGKRHHDTFWIKIDQMMAGLISGSKSGFLVRVDYADQLKYTPEGIARGKEIITEFLRDLYAGLDPQARKTLFG